LHSKGRHFQNGRRQNRQNCNVLWFQWKLISSVILKCRKLLMVSDFNAHWYLWVFWSEELVGNDAICIQGHFYEATNFKMAANKIVKLSTVSDFNENWYLGVFWSEELVGNDETCIHMPEFWYGGRLGTSVFASKHNQTSFCIVLYLIVYYVCI
jgi:hypothetical protein